MPPVSESSVKVVDSLAHCGLRNSTLPERRRVNIRSVIAPDPRTLPTKISEFRSRYSAPEIMIITISANPVTNNVIMKTPSIIGS